MSERLWVGHCQVDDEADGNAQQRLRHFGTLHGVNAGGGGWISEFLQLELRFLTAL